MIGKVTRKRMDGGSSFKRLIEYIEEAKKADWQMTSDNIVSLKTAAVEMKLVADQNTGYGDPVYHRYRIVAGRRGAGACTNGRSGTAHGKGAWL